MIQAETQNNITNTGGVKESDFGMDVNASMYSLVTRKVYNDPIAAVIREWSTNAIDACKYAKKNLSFYVHIPTTIEPTFYVRDYGTGLAKEDIEGKDGEPGLFTTLGRSTKRGSNEFNGTFG